MTLFSRTSRLAGFVAARADEVIGVVGVNERWESMKSVCLGETEVCGCLTKGPPRCKETLWWNEVVEKEFKKKWICFKI